MSQEELFRTAFWILAIIVTLIVLKKIWPVLSKTVQIVDAVVELPDFVERTDKDLNIVKQQVANSHKTNLRDDLTKALELSEQAVTDIGKLDQRVDKLEQREVQVSIKTMPVPSEPALF